jgi:predicted O-methyltransferase YrrM
MYSGFQLALKYLRYYLTASNGKGHGTHSPFVFEFITKVLNDRTAYPDYEQVEQLRRELLQDQTLLTIQDMGAGSVVSKTNQRTVASIAKNAAKPKKYGQLLYRMARHYQPKQVIELGTSLGITTSYLSRAVSNAGSISTVEGASPIAEVARQNFAKQDLKNITLINKPFDDCLAELQKADSRIDLLFIDGNHRKEPTLRYYEHFLPYMDANGMMIFDDIHWSREMEEAWEIIRQHPAVRCTIDLFFIGIVLFRSDFKEKQHFSIRF